jgi:predicted phosphodiesterase
VKGVRDDAAWVRMEEAYQRDPTIGRFRLMELAAVGASPAQYFLHQKRHSAEPVAEVAPPPAKADPRWERLKATLSPQELEALCKSAEGGPKTAARDTKLTSRSTAFFRVAVITDTHIGHKRFREDWLLHAFQVMKDEDVEAILHVGDIVEGMSGRPGHIYELTHIGFQAQVGYAASLFERAPVPIRAVLGNHDLWFAGKGDAGVDVGAELALRLPDLFECLGYHEADVVVNGIRIKLWHGMDGKAYAKSYRGQKIVESFPGGGKPHLLLLGHAHDSAFYVARNVHVFECGTFSLQSDFMRYTKKEASPGWWLIEVWGENGDLQEVRQRWFPFFLES